MEESFSKLLGRQPTDTDRKQLYQVRDALGLKNNDALWLVLMALQAYQTYYASVPAAISKAAGTTLAEVKKAAEQTMEVAARQTEARLADAVAAAAQDVARHTAQKQMWKWALGCIAGASLLLVAVAWFSYDKGYDSGEAMAIAAAVTAQAEQKAAVSWATTPQGKLAYRLYLAGHIDHLAACSMPGWKIEDGTCYPYPSKDGTYGWRLKPLK